MATRTLLDANGYPPVAIDQLNMTGLQREIDQRVHEMADVVALASVTQADTDLYEALEARWTELCDARDRIRRQPRPNVRDVVNGGQTRSERGAFDPGRDRPQTSGGGSRDAALRRIDSRRDLPDDVRDLMARSIDTARGPERDRLSRWIAASCDETYERAISRWLTDPVTGPALWDDAERAAVRRVTDEARALTLAPDSAGGYLVGSTVDFSVMLTNAGSVDPMRRLARQVTTTTDSWAGITSAGVTASWDAEAAEVSDDSPAFGSPAIPVFKGSAYAQASWEVASDAAGDLGRMLAPLFADARDQLEAASHTLGTGVGEPKGIIPAVSAVGGSVVVDNTASPTAVTLKNATDLQNALPARWRPRAQFMANLTVLNMFRQQVGGTGLTTPALGDDGRLLGWQANENSIMDGTITGSTADYLLICGDFSNYVIVDRVGMSITPIPWVMGPNRRPTSEVGWLCRWRSGGDVPTGLTAAFRLLNLSG